MLKRLLIAVPFAAAVVVALFGAMGEFAPKWRVPEPSDNFIIEPGRKPGLVLRDPQELQDRPLIIYDFFGPFPPQPTLLPPEPEKPHGRVPRERLLPPDVTPPDRLHLPRRERDPCTGQYYEPRDYEHQHPATRPRRGDYVILEFTLSADGVPCDINVVESSSPEIHDYAIASAQHWRYRISSTNGKRAEQAPKRMRVRIEF